MTQLPYFAYGSNMCRTRLEERVGPVEVLGTARAVGWRFALNKHSENGSAKANLMADATSSAWGVIYRLPPGGFEILDRFEPNYQRVELAAENGSPAPLTAWTYTSDWLTFDCRATAAYRQYLVDGALEHGLPGEVVRYLKALRIHSPSDAVR